jgi:hypothetical protein
LQFHHLDPNKKSFSISRYPLKNIDDLLVEIEKCELLCSNCHLKKHSTLGENLAYESSHKHGQKKRMLLIKAFGGECKICSEKNIKCLQFHHLDKRTKSFSIGSNIKKNAHNIWTEAEKCILLCGNCHKEVENGVHRKLEKQWVGKIHSVLSHDEWVSIFKKPAKQIKFCCCGKEICVQAEHCRKCYEIKQRKVKRPTYKQLLKDIDLTNYTKTGDKYGASDNAIRKWIKVYEKEVK